MQNNKLVIQKTGIEITSTTPALSPFKAFSRLFQH